MKKIYYSIVCALLAQCALADGVNSVINKNDSYISTQNYIQNPFSGLPSGGGTQNVTESALVNQDLITQVLQDGTWNLYSLAAVSSSMNGASAPSSVYGASLFAQTGRIYGFSLGGLFNLMNPVMNYEGRSTSASSQYLSSVQQNAPLELYVDYQFSHIVSVDAGWIGIDNSPWLGGNYYNNMTSALNYQGVLVNVNPVSGLLVTGVALNGALSPGLNGFQTGSTLYNNQLNWAQGVYNPNSSATYALGVNYYTPDNNNNLRVWGYDFENYANLAYVDDTQNIPINKDWSVKLQAQGGKENGDTSIAASATNFGDVDSDFAGLQATLNYDAASLAVAFNNIWGPNNAFGSGGIVSPYTYNINLDPLYTTSWIGSMVGSASAGQAFKIAPSINLFNNDLSLTASYTRFQPSVAAISNEYDFIATYNVPQIKGLSLFGVFAYADNPLGPNQSSIYSVDNYATEFMVSYLY